VRRKLIILLFAAALAGLAGCGGEEEESALPETVEGTTTAATTTQGEGGEGGEGDATAGKEVFSSAGCGSCHALSDAGASGTVGPNLDESQPDFDLVVERVTNGQGAMPSFSGELSEQQIQDVAAYVSESAGS
jgi:mono/diheme cytochrome c family protein